MCSDTAVTIATGMSMNMMPSVMLHKTTVRCLVAFHGIPVTSAVIFLSYFGSKYFILHVSVNLLQHTAKMINASRSLWS